MNERTHVESRPAQHVPQHAQRRLQSHRTRPFRIRAPPPPSRRRRRRRRLFLFSLPRTRLASQDPHIRRYEHVRCVHIHCTNRPINQEHQQKKSQEPPTKLDVLARLTHRSRPLPKRTCVLHISAHTHQKNHIRPLKKNTLAHAASARVEPSSRCYLILILLRIRILHRHRRRPNPLHQHAHPLVHRKHNRLARRNPQHPRRNPLVERPHPLRPPHVPCDPRYPLKRRLSRLRRRSLQSCPVKRPSAQLQLEFAKENTHES